jgi:prephenate dehydratase
LRRALEELSFFSTEVRVLGVYRAAPFRLAQGQADAASAGSALPVE